MQILIKIDISEYKIIQGGKVKITKHHKIVHTIFISSNKYILVQLKNSIESQNMAKLIQKQLKITPYRAEKQNLNKKN